MRKIRNMYIKKSIFFLAYFFIRYIYWKNPEMAVSDSFKRSNYSYWVNLKYVSKISKLNYIQLTKQLCLLRTCYLCQVCFISQLGFWISHPTTCITSFCFILYIVIVCYYQNSNQIISLSCLKTGRCPLVITSLPFLISIFCFSGKSDVKPYCIPISYLLVHTHHWGNFALSTRNIFPYYTLFFWLILICVSDLFVSVPFS